MREIDPHPFSWYLIVTKRGFARRLSSFLPVLSYSKGNQGYRVTKFRVLLLCLLASAASAKAQTNFFIQNIQRNTNGSVQITLPATPSQTYHVMYCDGITNIWQDFTDGKLTAATNAITVSYTDINAPTVSQRFYKVRIEHPQLIMTLVLDRSGSMGFFNPPVGSGGGAYLPDAVTNFISLFDDSKDDVSMVSFATTASVDVPMGKPFKNAIISAATNLLYAGATFSQGGLAKAQPQNNSVVLQTNQAALKVVVFLTDGLANMIQDTLSCPSQTTWNFGGYDAPNQFVAFFDPSAPVTAQGQGQASCFVSDNGTPSCCPSTGQFFSQLSNSLKSFTQTNVSAEAKYRSLQTANQMRAQGMYIFSIGLGSTVDTTFLRQIANDPASPTFNPALPVGATLTTTNAADLTIIFHSIASKILSF